MWPLCMVMRTDQFLVSFPVRISRTSTGSGALREASSALVWRATLLPSVCMASSRCAARRESIELPCVGNRQPCTCGVVGGCVVQLRVGS